MGAERNLNPDQLRMFMTPTEIKQQYAPWPGDVDPDGEGRTEEEMWADKRYENQDRQWDRPGLTPLADTNLAEISNPVRLGPMNIGNGHHRIEAGVEDEEQGDEVYLPVLHYNSARIAMHDGQYQSYGNYDEYGNWVKGKR